MKKLFALILTIYCLSVYSQSLTVSIEGIECSNNSTNYFILPIEEGYYQYWFEIINNSNEEFPLMVRKEVLSMAEDATFDFCFAGECWSTEYSETPYVMAPGEVLNNRTDEFNAFHIQYVNGVGTTKVKLTFFNENNIDDNFALFMVISNEPVSIAKNQSENRVKAFPNPANQQVTISYELQSSLNNNFNLSLTNFVGQKMRNIALPSHSGEVKLDISDLTRGIYFYTIENNNRVIISKKLIVQ